MSRNHDSLLLGKGKAFFVKSRLKRLPQEDETWEADFRALPKPIMQTTTHYLGLVLTRPHGFLLSHHEVERTPTVNDLARLLAEAMRRPGTEDGPHRPRCIHLRGNPRWTDLFPYLKEIGIKVLVRDKLPKVNEAFEEFLQQEKKDRRAGMVKPTTEQAAVEKLFPAIAKWVQGYGHFEIGDQESFGFVVRALSYGGMVFEDDRPGTLAEAMAVLEEGLARWFKDEGIEYK